MFFPWDLKSLDLIIDDFFFIAQVKPKATPFSSIFPRHGEKYHCFVIF